MNNNNEPLLQITNINACYNKIPVIHDLSISVFEREIVAIIGANGAGKTSTLLCASGILKMTSGAIYFRGQNISKYPSHERVKLGLIQVPEGRKIFPRMTVAENLQLGSYLHFKHKKMREVFEQVLTLFPALKDRLSQLGGTLSGGEQQMLAISRALMSRPKLLLLDEPSMGVAPILTQSIFTALQSLNAQGITIVLVEQNANLALKIANRGYVLETGRIVLENTGNALLNDPRVKAAYLGD